LACVGLGKQLSGPKSRAAKAYAPSPQQAMSRCPEYDQLSSKLDDILKKSADTTTLQLEIFRQESPVTSCGLSCLWARRNAASGNPTGGQAALSEAV
jgi:hypothetical protein